MDVLDVLLAYDFELLRIQFSILDVVKTEDAQSSMHLLCSIFARILVKTLW